MLVVLVLQLCRQAVIPNRCAARQPVMEFPLCERLVFQFERESGRFLARASRCDNLDELLDGIDKLLAIAHQHDRGVEVGFCIRQIDGGADEAGQLGFDRASQRGIGRQRAGIDHHIGEFD